MTPALTPKEIAELERLSPDAVYREIQAGGLPAPGDSFSCFGRAPRGVEFSYDGDKHENDLRSCHYTPLKGVVAYQENVDDWAMLGRAYATAAKAASFPEPLAAEANQKGVQS